MVAGIMNQNSLELRACFESNAPLVYIGEYEHSKLDERLLLSTAFAKIGLTNKDISDKRLQHLYNEAYLSRKVDRINQKACLRH